MVAVMRCLELVLAAAMLTCAMGDLIKVGGRNGWAENVNYTDWAANRSFHVGEWLYFVFDKRYYNVLEVNKSSYDGCNDLGFIKNITRGGRDVYNLTEARSYYFLSSGGYCFHGMKLAIDVENQLVPSQNRSLSHARSDASPRASDNNLLFFFLFVVASFLSFILNKF